MRRRAVLHTGAVAGLVFASGCSTNHAPSDGNTDGIPDDEPPDDETSDDESSDDESAGDDESSDDDPSDDEPSDEGTAYEPLGSISVDRATEAVVGSGGETVFVAAENGFVTVDVRDPANPTILAEDRDLLGNEYPSLTGVQDVAVDGDRLAVVGPANPAGGNVFNGLVVFDVSDPADPVRVGDPFETDAHVHNGFVDGDYIYLVVNDGVNNPVVVVDASDDDLSEIGRWSVRDREPEWGDVPWQAWYTHDVFVQDDLAVVSNWNAGTYLLDVSDPSDPTYTSHVRDPDVDLESQREIDEFDREGVRRIQLSVPGNDHYATVDESASLMATGREAWGTDSTDQDGIGGIDLFDVGDRTEPEYLSTIDPPTSPDATYEGTWTTAHNFELRGDHLYSSWYQGGVKIHDISDPTAPEELAWWRDPESAGFWTARVAEPGTFFVASSTAIIPGTNIDGGLYTFPIEAGEQEDPPSLT